MNLMDYVNHYRQHYAVLGKKGAGTGEWVKKWDLWQKIGFKPSMSVLDYGCGYGVMLEAPIDRKRYYGVDIAPEVIDIARKEYPDAKFDVFLIGHLKCEPVDFAVAHSVFTHTPKDTVLDSLGDIKRNLKPKGMAIIDVILGVDQENDLHVRRYNEAEWLDYLQRAKLKAKLLGVIPWENGNTHTYYKVTHA